MSRFFAFLFCCFLFTVSGFAKQGHNQNYIAVVDAGSSGSRLHVFTYELDQTSSPINIKQIWVKKINPGLATIETDFKKIDSYFNRLFSDAPQKKMPVYFYATAGMRLIPRTKQDYYYKRLKDWFNKQSQWQLQDARTITGKEEGVFDWLSVNYQSGALLDENRPFSGVMDIGGASVQVVFPLQNTISGNQSNKVDVNLYGKNISLYVHSFLGLGQVEVAHQYLDSASCFPLNYVLPDGTKALGDGLTCEREISALMNGVHRVDQVVQPVLSANPVHSWYVMGGIVHMAQDKLFQFKNNQLTTQGLLSQADKTVCREQWQVLQQKYPSNHYLYGYCLLSAYYYSLIVDGYGLNSEQKINYLPSNKADDWTLGVVLNHNN